MPATTRRQATSRQHSAPSASLLNAPPEVIFCILANLDPVDVAALSQTSRALHAYVAEGNVLLWRTLFLNLFDMPDPDQPPIGDYCQCVKDRCKARGIVRAPHRYKQAAERSFVLRTLESILMTTPRTLPLGTSKNAACLEALLGPKSATKDWLTVVPPWTHASCGRSDVVCQDKEARDLDRISSQLHLAGMSMREVAGLTYKFGQPYRQEVYRGSNYDETNLFGPYEKRTDGQLVIDWLLLNAIATVMALNVHGAWHQWGEESEQETLPYGFSKAVFWRSPREGKDWACITGRWNYIYAFIDYNDYFAYNFSPLSAHDQGNNLDGISEAVGGINSLELALAPEEEQEWDQYPNNPYPPLKFVGQSTGPTGSSFRGLVKMLNNGFRHWEFTIHYSGSDRWQTSGVEVGGRGVYGVWSDVLHEDLSPCGPVWYFRS